MTDTGDFVEIEGDDSTQQITPTQEQTTGVQTRKQKKDSDLLNNTGGRQSANERGNMYFTAREDALQGATGNQPLTAYLLKMKYRDARPRSQRGQPSVNDVQQEFLNILPQDFFDELRKHNPGVYEIIVGNMFAKNGGGITITLPKAKEYMANQADDVKQARRILRPIKGVMQAKRLNAKKFDKKLLAQKKSLSAAKKLADPSFYISQLRNYVRKYKTTNAQLVVQRAQENITKGLETVKNSILQKVNRGVVRTQNFPRTSVQDSQVLDNAKIAVSKSENSLGISSSSTTPSIPWANFTRI